MRTTITLDERLVDQLKRRAAEQGTSVSQPLHPEVLFTFERLDFRIAGEEYRVELDRGRHGECVGVSDGCFDFNSAARRTRRRVASFTDTGSVPRTLGGHGCGKTHASAASHMHERPNRDSPERVTRPHRDDFA